MEEAVKKLPKYLQPLYIVFSFEVLIVLLTALDFLPRWFAWPLTAGLAGYIIFASLDDALFLFIASIPLFVALPVTPAFDSMSNWRILLAVLFLALFFKRGISLALVRQKSESWLKGIKLIEKHKHYLMEYLAGFFLIIGALSLFAAVDAVAGVKKLLFLINAFLLFVVIRNVAKTKEAILKVARALFVAAAVALFAGYGQFISIFFASLYDFWQWWAGNVIPVFYGRALGELLAVSNTWFSYYADRPPSLRLFSVFPDSHSFGLFMVLSVPILLTVFYGKKKFGYYPVLVFFLSAVILSGSRGIWLSAALPFAVGLYLFFKKSDWKSVLKPILLSFAALVLLFPVVSVLLGASQESPEGEYVPSSFALAFKRAKSISDISETSNLSRLQIWQKSLKAISQRPFLGVGVGNYPRVLEQDIEAGKKGASAHNLYLDVASEAGIAAVLVLILIFVEMLRISHQILKQSKEPVFSVFAASFGLYIFWVLGYNLFDVVLLNDKVLLFFTASTAILFSVKNILDERSHEQTSTIGVNKSPDLQRPEIS